MAFNKTKIVETAQKYLNQGRIPQAIEQYQQLLQREPEDQVTLMTIGDLYVRAHDIRQALDYFERLAQLFANDGFTSKSIAIYKKIAKLAPDEIGPLERLAELYVQQGVMSEARPIYLQLAEAHLKANRTSLAVEVLKKLLELSPDNLRVQVRLAELYEGLGQPRAAADAFTGAAQRMLEKGEVKEAQRLADRAAKADPNNPGGLALKASILAESGQGSEAVALLEKATPTDETGTLLTEMYLQSGDAEKAVAMGRKAIGRGAPHFGVAYNVALALIGAGEADRGVQLLGEMVKPAIDAGDTERLAQMLGTASAQLPGRLEPLEWRAQVYRRTGDTYHLPESLAAIAAAATEAHDLPRAKAAYEELLRNDPENENYRQSLAHACALMGLEAPVHVEAEAPPQVDITPVEAAPVAPEPQLDEETERFVQQALTDVDLFSSYGLTQKGIDLLESVLQRVPNHALTLEKLLDLYLGAGNERRTAELAAHLQQIYTDRDDGGNAERFAELRRRFERAAGRTEAAAAEPPPAEFAVPAAPPSAQPEQVEEVEAEPVEAEVHEVDLSEEWATIAETAPPDAAPPPPDVPVEAAEPESEFRMEIDAGEEAPPVPAPAEVPASPPDEAVGYDLSPDDVMELAPEPAQPAPAEPAPQPVGSQSAADNRRPTAEAFDQLSAQSAEGVQAPAAAEEAAYEIGSPRRPAEPLTPVEPAAMTSDQFLSELGAELEDFEFSAPPAAPAAKSSGKQAAAAAAPPRGRKQMDQLREVFDEFKAEMGEVGDAEAETEDLETHYNLGIAYREMGLLEEAIGEFQKVAKSIKGGRPFRYSMQCYTLLGLCFMDKNQPKIAAIWYEQALRTPELDQESILAVRYDLGVAHELAGDSQAALDSFSQVYAMNIDYRDVAERITALSKQT
ncbi:MAG: tetratricopeptide repeat protein [Candidatus Acidiferrales bacterium]